jgi:hypothetical protein
MASLKPFVVMAALGFFDGESDIDEADMCERLREISERFARPGVYLFGE